MSVLSLKRLFALPVRFVNVLKYASSLYDQREQQLRDIQNIRSLGENTKIEENVSISWPSRLCIGKHCLVQSDCILHSMGGIHIGDYVGIGSKSVIVSFGHNYLRSTHLPYDNVITVKPVIIRDFVWIGFAVHVMPGVEIGEGAIIGMGSTVTKNVPPLAVVSGNPAEVVGYRNKKHYERCKKEKKFAGPRLYDFFGNYKFIIPRYFMKKYSAELLELGLLEEKLD